MGKEIALRGILLVLSIAVATVAAQDYSKVCAQTLSPPNDNPPSLVFCRKYNSRSCCLPTHDAEDQNSFENLVDLGRSCRIRGDVRTHPIAEWYCIGCDPNLPTYMTEVSGRWEIAICKTFALRLWNYQTKAGQLPGQGWSECGLMLASPCNFDRYDCGDDIWIPFNEINANSISGFDTAAAGWTAPYTEEQQAEAFMNYQSGFGEANAEFTFQPPEMPDVYYKVVEDSVGNCFMSSGAVVHPQWLLMIGAAILAVLLV